MTKPKHVNYVGFSVYQPEVGYPVYVDEDDICDTCPDIVRAEYMLDASVPNMDYTISYCQKCMEFQMAFMPDAIWATNEGIDIRSIEFLGADYKTRGGAE